MAYEAERAVAQSIGVPVAKRHIFLCCDQTKPKCCEKERGLAAWDYLKARLKELGLSELLETRLEIVPGRQAALFLAALRLRLIAAEKDVPLRDGNTNALRDDALGLKHRIPPGSISARARPAAPC